MVDEGQAQRVLGYIEKGVAEGAQLVLGGKRADTVSGGSYIEPTVFDGVAHEHTISREEIFGPVLSVIALNLPKMIVLSVANLVTLGLANRLYSNWSDKQGEVDVWPFIRRPDYAAALERPVYLKSN